jgi:hypothetical protein
MIYERDTRAEEMHRLKKRMPEVHRRFEIGDVVATVHSRDKQSKHKVATGK